jgi:DNA-binding CsgD family transcriptional regulator/tetratricopeptide (TPR) repeat protein
MARVDRTSDHRADARACYDRGAWNLAFVSFAEADRDCPLEVDDLDRFATSAYLSGREPEFQRVLERQHRAHVEAGDRPRAARCASWLALSFMLRGEVGQSNAWVARGQRLVDDEAPVERGYLLLPLIEQQIRGGELDAAHAASAAIVTIAEASGEADLAAAARHGQGRALIQQGQVASGLRLLDETMLAVVAGELSPIMTGLMYCSVIATCREVYALSRAREWTSALSRWCEQQSEMVFTGACLVHRAEIMQLHGDWPDAMAEACRASERARRADRKPPAAALYQQAEIHRLRGEFAQAEEAYRAASLLGYEPQPGLALLRMAQERSDVASAAIRRLLSATTDRLQRARLLPAHLDIMLGVGDLEEGRRACAEIQTLAELFDTDALHAIGAHARGATALAEGHAQAALGPLRQALDAWQRLEAPYESARTRVLMGLACRDLGDREASALEFAAARATFEHLGARPDLVRLDALEASRDAHPLTARERDVLRLVVAGQTNKAIAAALGLSERTIDRHVSNILTKLDVPSRAAATARAYDRKLI